MKGLYGGMQFAWFHELIVGEVEEAIGYYYYFFIFIFSNSYLVFFFVLFYGFYK